MQFDDLLAPVGGMFDIENALSSWRWLVPQPVKPLAMTALGDLFVIDGDGAVLFLDTAYGKVGKAAASLAELEEKLKDPKRLAPWFRPELVRELRARAPLARGECYSPVHTPGLGGKFTAKNWAPTNWSVHLAFAGALHEQLKDLPPGTKVTGIRFPKL